MRLAVNMGTGALIICGMLSVSLFSVFWPSYPIVDGIGQALGDNDYFYLSNLFLNSTIRGSTCLFSAEWNSSNGLSGFVFGWNDCGAWTNDTWIDPWMEAPSQAWANVTKLLPGSMNNRVEYQFWANDTAGNWATSGKKWFRTNSLVSTNLPRTVVANAIKYSFQKKMFVALGLSWLFYSNDTAIHYRTSPDLGATWSVERFLTFVADFAGSFSCERFDDSIHYAKTGSKLWYRKGTLNADGTTTWVSDEVVVLDEAGYDYAQPCINLNGTGYPWIAYQRRNATTTLPYVVKSDVADGSWSMTPSFPYRLNSTSHIYWIASPEPLQSTGEMYVVYGHDGQGWFGRHYSHGWGPVEHCSSSPIECAQRNDVSSWQDEVRIVYHVRDGGHVYVCRGSDGSWSPEYCFADVDVPSGGTPALTITPDGTDYVYWFTSNHTLYYRWRDEFGWASPVEWLNEAENVGEEQPQVFLAQIETESDRFGFAYVASNPAQLRFSYIVCEYATDVNHDGKVDILDLAIVSAAFGSLQVSDPLDSRFGQYWHPTACRKCPHVSGADVNCDSRIDSMDLSRISGSYGKHRA